jgi:phage shock protein C
MYCTHCGTQVADTARFCTVCGQPLAPSATSAPQPFEPAPTRRLRRIIANKKIAGVCAGFAEYFETDVALMRIIWIALALLPPGIGLIAYVVAWIVLPKG